MKPASKLLLVWFLGWALVSCSAESLDVNLSQGSSANDKNNALIESAYDYNASEFRTLQLINDYRLSVGLTELEKVNYISIVSQDHNKYMISKHNISHDDFVSRSNDIIKKLGAKKVGENLAFNYKTPEAVVQAWLDSASHKVNLEGDYTHFGISITIDAQTGKTYYTNIFAKI